MSENWNKLGLEVLLVAVVVVVSVACESDQQVQEEVSTTETAVTVSASTIVDDYKNNEVAADEKYKGKVVEVSGTIESIAKDVMDTMYVTLAGGGEFEMRSVQCYFADSEKDKLASLSKGSRLTVKGRCEGLMMNVQLKGCTIVE